MKVVIKSCLTEPKLAAALQQMVGNRWAGGQLTLPGSRRRFDMACRTSAETILVEYDGDQHYRDCMRIKADQEKDILISESGLRLVRVRYWVQMDKMMAGHWFGLEADIEQSYPHGFITTKLIPASYCELGIARFRQELDSLPTPVRDAVVDSVRGRVAEHRIEYVLPAELRALITA